MKYLTAIFIFLGWFATCSGQARIRHFDDADNIKTYVVRVSDTVIIEQDSVMMMNRKTYMIYESLRRNNTTYKILSKAYDSLLLIKETMYQAQIKKQTDDYGKLHNLLDSLTFRTMSVASNTNLSLREIKDSLNSSAQILNLAKANLIKTEKELKHERIQKILGKFYWGIGGVGIGAAGAALAFLLLHK